MNDETTPPKALSKEELRQRVKHVGDLINADMRAGKVGRQEGRKKGRTAREQDAQDLLELLDVAVMGTFLKEEMDTDGYLVVAGVRDLDDIPDESVDEMMNEIAAWMQSGPIPWQTVRAALWNEWADGGQEGTAV